MVFLERLVSTPRPHPMKEAGLHVCIPKERSHE
jgi:hypothetical protein